MNATDANKLSRLLDGGPQRIVARTEKCRCGCKGTDPWHKSTFKRVIKNVSIVEAVDACGLLESIQFATGRARFPWGTEAVVLTANRSPRSDYLLGLAWRIAS